MNDASQPIVRTGLYRSATASARVAEPIAFGGVTLLVYLGLAVLSLNPPEGFTGLRGWAWGDDHVPWMAQLYRELAPGSLITEFSTSAYENLARACLMFLVVLYGLMLWRVNAASWDSRALIALGVAVSLAAAAVLPLFTGDVMLYAALGQVVVEYGANPYTTSPDTFSNDPIVEFTSLAPLEATYSPLWILISAGLMWLASSSPLVAIMLFKALATAALIGTGLLVYHLSGRLAPEQQKLAYTGFALNPLILLLAAGNTQVDILIAFFSLLAMLALVQGRRGWSVVANTFGALVKLSHLPLLAMSLAGHRGRQSVRQRAWSLLKVGTPSLVLMIAFWVPFWEGPEIFRSLVAEADRGYVNVLTFYHSSVIAELTGYEVLEIGQIFAGVGAVLIAVLTLRALYRPVTAAEEVHRWVSVSAIIPLLWMRAQPWYWIVPLAMLAASPYQSRYLWPGIVVITAILMVRFIV